MAHKELNSVVESRYDDFFKIRKTGGSFFKSSDYERLNVHDVNHDEDLEVLRQRNGGELLLIEEECGGRENQVCYKITRDYWGESSNLLVFILIGLCLLIKLICKLLLIISYYYLPFVVISFKTLIPIIQ
mgnify:CR=1 FL=1